MTHADLNLLSILELLNSDLIHWFVPQPLLAQMLPSIFNGLITESVISVGGELWWLLPLILGFSGLIGWQELQRRQMQKQLQELEGRLAESKVEAQELRERLAQREECIMHLSHELRNPLNQVIGEAELALRENGRSQSKGELKPVLRALRRLAWRIDSIEHFYALSDNRWVSLPEIVDVEAWLQTQASSLDCSELSIRVGFSVSIDNPEHIRRAEFNAGDLRTVLRHLVHNAIRFTTEGQITVKLSISSTAIVAEVSDTGCGFDTALLDTTLIGQGNLAFFQADRSRTKQQQGLGLGLAICRELARRVGGHLQIESEIGRGTVARFSLPLRVVEVQPALRQAIDDMALPSILVVDDDPANQEFMVEVCRRNGWQVDVAWNGEEALRRVEKKHYDVILMDGAMPQMDGFEATRQIRKLEAQEGRQSTIVATTGLTSPQDQRHFWEAGVDSFVAKPIDPREITSLIRMHLGN